jgi:hypothetical protein
MSGLFDEINKARKVLFEEVTGVNGLGACGGVLKNGGSADSGGGASACKESDEGIRFNESRKLIRQLTRDDPDGAVKSSSGHD